MKEKMKKFGKGILIGLGLVLALFIILVLGLMIYYNTPIYYLFNDDTRNIHVTEVQITDLKPHLKDDRYYNAFDVYGYIVLDKHYDRCYSSYCTIEVNGQIKLQGFNMPCENSYIGIIEGVSEPETKITLCCSAKFNVHPENDKNIQTVCDSYIYHK